MNVAVNCNDALLLEVPPVAKEQRIAVASDEKCWVRTSS